MVGTAARDDDKTPKTRIIHEDRITELVLSKLGSGHVEFVERRDDDTLTIYDVYFTKADTLMKIVCNGRTGTFEVRPLDPAQGRMLLQARMLAKTRAENAALEAVAGQVLRWKLKCEEEKWYYWFRIETPRNKWKNVYIDRDSFEVIKIKTFKKFDETGN